MLLYGRKLFVWKDQVGLLALAQYCNNASTTSNVQIAGWLYIGSTSILKFKV